MDRAERRRREREDERAIARGIDVERRDPGQIASLMRLAHREIVRAREAGSLAGVFRTLFGNLAISDAIPPREAVACRRGCSHCCMMWVSATAPEVLHLAAALRASGRDIAAIVERCRGTAGLDFNARATFVHACPLLAADGSCSAYAARPMACRTAASFDVEVCRRGYIELSGEDIPVPMSFLLRRLGYNMALRGAFLHAGRRLENYELNEALAAALTTEDAERRWLAGDDVFDGVRRDPGANPLDQPGVAGFIAGAFD